HRPVRPLLVSCGHPPRPAGGSGNRGDPRELAGGHRPRRRDRSRARAPVLRALVPARAAAAALGLATSRGGDLRRRSAAAPALADQLSASVAPAVVVGGGLYYQDVTWHLSIVHELTRSFPPEVAQLAGQTLRYHWFSHVHLAAAHL